MFVNLHEIFGLHFSVNEVTFLTSYKISGSGLVAKSTAEQT